MMSKVLTPSLSKAARVLLGWSQDELGQKANIGVRSVTRFEAANGQQTPGVRDKLYDAFTAAGIQFIASNSDTADLDGVGLRFKPSNPRNGIKIL